MPVAPGLFVRESHGVPSGSASMPRSLQEAETVSATLDAVVLEDGQVLGPDASHTVDSLRARKATINALLNAVRAAEQNGQDGVEVLQQIANAWQGLGNAQESAQLRMFAHTLLTSRNWRGQLEQLAAIQLPNFYR